jgi:hypothetical protein
MQAMVVSKNNFHGISLISMPVCQRFMGVSNGSSRL